MGGLTTLIQRLSVLICSCSMSHSASEGSEDCRRGIKATPRHPLLSEAANARRGPHVYAAINTTGGLCDGEPMSSTSDGPVPYHVGAGVRVTSLSVDSLDSVLVLCLRLLADMLASLVRYVAGLMGGGWDGSLIDT